jgi:kinetochore protein NDC80
MFPHEISEKIILNPTQKEFNKIIVFLFQQFDLVFDLKLESKIQDEVPLMFRRLGYPFQISKSSFYSIGSPTTWPSLLAAMSWLIPLLEFKDRKEHNKTLGMFNNCFAENEYFFEYYTKGYKYFLSGEDSFCKILDKELKYSFDKRSEEFVDIFSLLVSIEQFLVKKIASIANIFKTLVLVYSQNFLLFKKKSEIIHLTIYQRQKLSLIGKKK